VAVLCYPPLTRDLLMQTYPDIPDVPLWAKWIAGLGVALTWAWALIRPWHNERWVAAMKQCTAQLEKHLREGVFKTDIAERDLNYAKVEALEDAVKALSASALAQGKILDEWPQFSRILTKLETTMSNVSRTMERMEDRIETQGSLVDRVVGAIEAQQQKPAPRRKPRPRT
jgi:hypothetical protein